MTEARKRAEKITYNFDIQGNTLLLDNYLITNVESKFKNQKVEIYLYLPEGTTFKPDDSVHLYDETRNDFFDLWFDSDKYIYRMGDNSVKCLNCPEEDGNSHDEDNDDWHYESDNRHNGNVNGNITISDKDVDVKVNIKNDSISRKANSKTN